MPRRCCRSWQFAARVLVGCALAPLLSGCGGQPVGTVSGKVTFEGQPLPEGIVSFVTDKGEMITGRLHDGDYEVEQVPVGPARITVRQIVDPFAHGKDPKSSAVKEIPFHYRSPDDSGLRYEVVSGKQTHDIELKAR